MFKKTFSSLREILKSSDYHQNYLFIKSNQQFITHFRNTNQQLSQFSNYILQLENNNDDSQSKDRLLKLLKGQQQGYFKNHNLSQINNQFVNNEISKIGFFLIKDDYELILKLLIQHPDYIEMYQQIILKNMDKIPQNCLSIIIQICKFESRFQKQLCQGLLNRLMKQPKYLKYFYRQLFRLFKNNDYKRLMFYHYRSLKMQEISVKDFLINLEGIILDDEDIKFIQNLINQQDILEFIIPFLKIYQKNKFYLNELNKTKIMNYLRIYETSSNSHHMINIYLKFLLEYGLQDQKYHANWESLVQKFKNNPKLLNNNVLLQHILSKITKLKVEDTIIQNIFVIVWMYLNYFNQNKVIMKKFQEYLKIFIDSNQKQLYQKNKIIADYNPNHSPDSYKYVFPRISNNSEDVQSSKKLTEYSIIKGSNLNKPEILGNKELHTKYKKQINSSNLENQYYLQIINYLTASKCLIPQERSIVCKQICNRLQSMNIKNLINVKNIYKQYKYDLPKNFIKNLVACLSNRIKTDMINSRIAYELIIAFKLYYFDNSTILFLEQKLCQGLERLKPREISILIREFEKLNKLSYKILQASHQLLIKQITEQYSMNIDIVNLFAILTKYQINCRETIKLIQNHLIKEKIQYNKNFCFQILLETLERLENPLLTNYKKFNHILNQSSINIFQKIYIFFYTKQNIQFSLEEFAILSTKFPILCSLNRKFINLIHKKINDWPKHVFLPFFVLIPQFQNLAVYDQMQIKQRPESCKQYFEYFYIKKNKKGLQQLLKHNIPFNQPFLLPFQVREISNYLQLMDKNILEIYQKSILHSLGERRQLVFQLINTKKGWSQKFIDEIIKKLQKIQ